MSNLLFRAWDGEKMVSPDFVNRAGVAYWEENSITERSSVIMQATGLKDKAGKRIYEGDIYYTYGKLQSFVVSFQSGAFTGRGIGDPREPLPLGWDGNDDDSEWVSKEIEVVGNIHQHPELLEAKGFK
jgi:hypothetical protein